MTDFISAARQAQADRRGSLLRALHGAPDMSTIVADDDAAPTPAGSGFDGGARQPAPPAPPTHGEVLADLIAQSRARETGNF